MSSVTARPAATSGRPAAPLKLREAGPLALAYAACLALLALHVDRAFGLPAHPLIVHLPVVAVPLLAVVSLVLAARPSLRERYGLAWAVLALVAFAGTVLAAGAGKALLADFGGAPRGALATHVDLADLLEWAVALLTAVVLLVVVLRRRLHGAGDVATRVLTVVLALAAAYYVVRVGDAGARAVWARG